MTGMLKSFFDWFFSETMSGPNGHTYRLLPEWPEWLCGELTDHKQELKYADYNVDIRGDRCRCGKSKQETIEGVVVEKGV